MNPVNITKFYFRSNLILSYHQRLGFLSGLQVYIKTLHAFVLFPIHATCPAQFTFRLMILKICLNSVLKL